MAAKRNIKPLAPIGKAIRERLMDLNMTQREFASRIGTSENYLNFILRGERSGDKYLGRIREELKLDVEKFRKSA